MNWLTSKPLTKLFVFISVLFAACDNPKDVGIELQQPQTNLGVVFTDTVTVQTSTVLVDSVNTTNTALLLAGEYTDPHFGKVTASSYFTITPARHTFDFGNEPTFNRVELALNHAYSYGDSTQSQTLNVHFLTENLDINRVYYRFDQLAYDPTPVGSITFKASEIKEQKLRIPLNETFKNQLAAFITSNTSASDTLTQAELDGFIKGIVLVPDGGNAILGFNVTQGLLSSLNLIYQNKNAETGEISGEITYEFASRNFDPTIVSNGRFQSTRFNRVICERQGTLIDGLDQNYEEFSEDATNNETFIQAALGLKTKITFPYISEFLKQGNLAINRADLVIRPLPNVAEDFYAYPSTLDLWRLTADGKAGKAIITQTVSGQSLVDTVIVKVQAEGTNPLGISSNLAISFDEVSRSFNGNITSYLQYVLNDNNTSYSGANKIANNGLLLSPNLASTTVNRIRIGGAKHPTSAMKLRIFYTLIESK